MATDKAKIVIYCPPELRDDYNQLAKDMNTTVSKLCGDLLADFLPQMKLVAEAQRLVLEDPRRAAEIIRQMSDEGQMDLLTTMQQIDKAVQNRD